MPVRRALVALATTATAVVATAGTLGATVAPAHAEVETVRDSARDAETRLLIGEVPARVAAGADVRALRAEHGGGRLSFAVRVADLYRGATRTVVDAEIMLPNEREYVARLEVAEGTRTVTLLDARRFEPVACDGLTGRVARADDRYLLSFPRACVFNPREVRYGAKVTVTEVGPEGSDVAEIVDDARLDGGFAEFGAAKGADPLVNN